jgi:hypothetical protein
MSHLHHGGKQYKAFLPFVNNTVKHVVRNYHSNEFDMAFHGKAPSTASPVLGKALHDVNPIKMHGYPKAQQSLMYGWGHGLPRLPNDPDAMRKAVHNRRSLVEVDNLDYSNYYDFKK